MYLEAVTVSVGYSDYLEFTMSRNRPHFDRYVVGTVPEDDDTIAVCAKYDVECVLTEQFKNVQGLKGFRGLNDDVVWCKSRGINECLARLSFRDWVLHMDADIVLTKRFRELLEETYLEECGMYSMVRYNTHRRGVVLSVYNDCFNWYRNRMRFSLKPAGKRAIGYFQLFHSRAEPFLNAGEKYCVSVNARGDGMFGDLWARDEQWLLSGACAHIHHGGTGENWKGRVTPPLDW